ncbi:hypothetical protein HanRHA438_Chr01g0037821 [Helianthus annuus]|nr:hypothetical protein HanRHA438_Chr01g0037821 [Helianthus annuus]
MTKRHGHNDADEAGSNQQMNIRIEENTKRLEEVKNMVAGLSLQLTQIVNNQTNTRTHHKPISEPISDLANFRSDLSKSTSKQLCSVVSDIRGEMGLRGSSRFIRTEFAPQVFDEMPEPIKNERKHEGLRVNESLTRNDDSVIGNELPKQFGNVKEYYDSFNTFISQLQISQEYALKCFLEGLKEVIQIKVRMFNPTTLYHAYCLAKLEEVVLESILRSPLLEVARESHKVEETESNDALEKVDMEFVGNETVSIWSGPGKEEKVGKKLMGIEESFKMLLLLIRVKKQKISLIFHL